MSFALARKYVRNEQYLTDIKFMLVYLIFGLGTRAEERGLAVRVELGRGWKEAGKGMGVGLRHVKIFKSALKYAKIVF